MLRGAHRPGRVVADPALAWNPCLAPCMRCSRDSFFIGEVDVAADVPRGHAHRARDRDEQMSKVLAHARAELEHLVHSAVDVGYRAVVLEVSVDCERQAIQRSLDSIRRVGVHYGVTSRKLSDAGYILDRASEPQEVLDQLFALAG